MTLELTRSEVVVPRLVESTRRHYIGSGKNLRGSQSFGFYLGFGRPHLRWLVTNSVAHGGSGLCRQADPQALPRPSPVGAIQRLAV